MRESDIEELATHGGPEPCVVVRGDGGEASVGVRAGWAIEPRKDMTRDADAVIESGRQHRRRRFASRRRIPRGLRTCACAESPDARTGRSHGHPPE